jgi:hypothetical protein
MIFFCEMERFFIKSPNAKPSSKVEEPPAKKSKKDYDKKYDTLERKRAFQDAWLKEFPWLRVNYKGAGTCKICRQFYYYACRPEMWPLYWSNNL